MMRINEIFYSLQGEGRNAGTPAIFIRFSGCNLSCHFCDTDFHSYTTYTTEQLLQVLTQYPAKMVVLTGGEPTLQATTDLVDSLHRAGYYVAMETNGTRVPPANVDWLTVSPKEKTVVTHCDELKVVFGEEGPLPHTAISARYYYLQPMDVGDAKRNADILQNCIRYVKNNPQWRLSLQTHKLINIP